MYFSLHLFKIALGDGYDITNNKLSVFVLVQVHINLALLHYQLELYKKPNGTKAFPAKTCKDLIMCYPDLKSGKFAIQSDMHIQDFKW